MAQEQCRPLYEDIYRLLPDLKTQVVFIVECIPRHDGFGAQSVRHPPFGGKKLRSLTA
jgi:hypothetical protein